jgi:NTE family protein
MPISSQVKPLGRREIGLALSSRVARGWAQIGALRALARLGVDFDILAGCSAGALVGGCHLARKLDELEARAIALNKRKLVSYLDLNLGRGGLIRGDRLIADLRGLLGPLRIEDLRIPFVAVATDLATGHEVCLQTGDLTETLRASFALPGLFPPIELDKRWLADGALVDPLTRRGVSRSGRGSGHRVQSQYGHHRESAPLSTWRVRLHGVRSLGAHGGKRSSLVAPLRG